MTSTEFSCAYLSLSDELYRVALYMMESQDEAEDVVQDVFIKLWQSRDSLDGIGNPKAYCLTLVRNACIDRIRKASRTRQAKAGTEELECEPAPPSESGLEAREKLREVIKLVEKLPPRQQEILRLRVFEGLSYEEISRRTGLNQLSLRVLLSTARKTIRKGIS